MDVKIGYGPNIKRLDIAQEAKVLAKEKGCKVKDIGYVVLHHAHWGISLQVYSKNHELITTCAC